MDKLKLKMYAKGVVAVIMGLVMGMVGEIDGHSFHQQQQPGLQQQRWDGGGGNVVIRPPRSSSLYSSLVLPSQVERQEQETSTMEPTTSTAITMDPPVGGDAVGTVNADDVIVDPPVSISTATSGMVDVVVPVQDAYDYTIYQGLLNSRWPAMTETCVSGKHQFDPLTQKRVYTVGVMAPAGAKTAWEEHNITFTTYLNAVVGPRFDPPIQFEMEVTTRPLNDWIDNDVGRENTDFMYSDSGIYSCVGLQLGAQPIATTVASLYARGRKFDLDVFGGIMFTTREHDTINSVADLKDKIIGSQVISDFAGAQAQFFVMQENGLDYIMDPKQVVFYSNNDDIVKAVLDGTVDVGFVRSGHVERTIDPSTGGLIDTEKLKTLDPRIYIMDNGELFPFLHSTPTFPEWPVFARADMDRVVAQEVQTALVSLGDHKKVGDAIYECLTSKLTSADQKEVCRQAPPAYFYDNARCDTTREIAEIARQAGEAGHHNGFRTPKSYFHLRTMQEAAGFVEQDERGDWKCIQADSLYEGIHCPEGTYKVKHDSFVKQCSERGLDCPDGTECFCRPCVQAFEVDVMQYGFDSWNQSSYGSASDDAGLGAAADEALSADLIASTIEAGEDFVGCDKMALCGKFRQRDTAKFAIHDNRERIGSKVRVVMHAGQDKLDLPVTPHPNISFLYEFHYTTNTRGISIMEIFIDDVQIPESPFRVETTSADCGDHLKEADGQGVCICAAGTVEIGAQCFDAGIFAAIVVSITAVIIVICTFFYLQHRRAKSDEVWQVKVDELHFGQKAEVIGQGSFGVVLLAEYRGTKVAIKRVLPVGGGSGSRHGSMSKPHKTGSVLATGGGNGSMDGMGGGTGSHTGSISRKQCRRVSKESGDSGSSDDKSSSDDEDRDIETGTGGTSSKVDPDVVGSICSDDDDFGFLGHLSYGRQKTKWERLLPNWLYNGSGVDQYNASILGTASASTYSRTVSQRICPWFTEDYRRKQEFIQEMRLLSRLRHPCITTVMGATVQHGRQEPMMVMEYMENGSLYDLLQNETLHISGDLIVQIFRDVSQGLRFLHASKPPILHGDLKAKNILVDSRFRAKVADFGLSKKTVGNLSGTPYWLAPEYLRGKTNYNAPCDVYSFGITMWETYSRSTPYAGENPRKVLRLVCDPRISKRPTLQGVGAPPKMIEIMMKCWSHDVGFRPTSKDLDMMFTDMSPIDAEPILITDEITAKLKRTQKAEGDMLYRVFPRKVADKLKAGQRVEAETHEIVTIFFSDIVHFTDISRELPAEKVCDMLGRLYEAFDALASKHEIFKVETIGDAWMGVTNLENTQSDSHVKRIAEFAVEAVEAASTIPIDRDDETKGFVKIRVGFHSGSVVSNVIGSLNPRYGLFGDTVNTASRMESNSKPGRIHCSEDAAMLLQEQAPNMPLQQRGKIQVKGKGLMLTYWVGKRMKGLKHSGSSVAGDDHTTMASKKKSGQDNDYVEKPSFQHVTFPQLSPHSSMGESGADGGDQGFIAKKAVGHLDVMHIDMTGDVGVFEGGPRMASAPDFLDTEDITENTSDFAHAPLSSRHEKKSQRTTSVDPPDSLTQTKLGLAETRAELKRSSSSAGAA